jgi:hypothetical protein
MHACERLGVSLIKVKLVQHHSTKAFEAPVHSAIISWTGNGMRGRGRLNLTWEEYVKRDLNDWSITKELVLDMRE